MYVGGTKLGTGMTSAIIGFNQGAHGILNVFAEYG